MTAGDQPRECEIIFGAPTLFGMPIPPEQQQRIDRYTRELTDNLERVAAEAIADRKPARLSWSKGRVPFAANRRTAGGPVDHDFPVLKIEDPNGKPRAFFVNYACHCTTLGASFNRVHGDWAGEAQDLIERSGNKDDRRLVELAITPRGTDVLGGARDATLSRIDEELTRLDEAQRRSLGYAMGLLRRLFDPTLTAERGEP